MPSTLLAGLRVVELGQRVSAPFCGRVLAGMGAQVVKVEPPEGDEARRMGPFPGDVPHPEKSGLFLALNVNKYGVALDLSDGGDFRLLRGLTSRADLVITDGPPPDSADQDSGYDALHERPRGQIIVSISPFGSHGPYAEYKAGDLVIAHMTGLAHTINSAVENPDSDPPVRPGAYQIEYAVGLSAATAAMMQIYRSHTTGLGCHVEVSAFGSIVNQRQSGFIPLPDSEAEEPGQSRLAKDRAPGPYLPCSDGHVVISPRQQAQWERWIELIGRPELAGDERFATPESRNANAGALWDIYSGWTRNYSKQELARRAQERRVPCFPVNGPSDSLADEHLAARDYFDEIDHPEAGKLKYPGVPYRLSVSGRSPPRPAPRLGEHNEKFLGGLE